MTKISDNVVNLGPHILFVCQPQTLTLMKAVKRTFRRMRHCSTVKEVISRLDEWTPAAIVSEIDLPDGKIWQIVNAVRSGRMCPSDTPVIGLTHGERCQALERMAEIRRVHLYHDPAMEDLADFISETLDRKPELHKILVIDDDRGVTSHVANVLAKSFSIEVANTGTKGLEVWMDHKHDLIILDLDLPDTHGVEVLKRIRSIDPDQPVLVLSGFLDKRNVAEISLHEATHCADKEILGTPKILMRRCLEALEWRYLNTALDAERRRLEQARLIHAAQDWLSDGTLPSTFAAQSLLHRAVTLDDPDKTFPNDFDLE